MLDKLEKKYQTEIRQLIPVRQLSSCFQDCLIAQAEIVMVPSGSSLIEQDEQSDSLFYLLSGEVDLSRDEKVITTIHSKNSQASLAINQYTSCAVNARSRVVIMEIDRCFVEKLVLLDSSLRQEQAGTNSKWLSYLLTSSVFEQIPMSNVDKLLEKLKQMVVKQGELITMQNKIGIYFYLIQEGRCIKTQQDEGTEEKVNVGELGPGQGFGKQALLSVDHQRETTVSMLSDGILYRLGQRDYDDLRTKKPIREVNFDQALEKTKKGAYWLDIRSEDEFELAKLQGSQNFPYTDLKKDPDKLLKQYNYIVYCDSGNRSAAATRILNEHGYKAIHLQGGIISYLSNASLISHWLEAPVNEIVKENIMDMKLLSGTVGEFIPTSSGVTQARNEAAQTNDEIVQSNVETTQISDTVIQSSNGVAQTRDVEDDLRYLDDAVVQQIQSVDDRIQKLKDIFEPVDHLLEQEQQPEIADMGILVEARKKIDQIESLPDRNTVVEETVAQEIEDSGIELSELQKQVENAQNHIQQERQRVSDLSDTEYLEQKDLTLKHVTDELEVIKIRLRDQEAKDEDRRQKYELELSNEREKMREQLALFSSGLEQQKARSMEVEQVRQLAAIETRQVIEKFKEVHKQYQIRQQQKLRMIREQLKRQAKHVISKARKAEQGKAQALAELDVMRDQLEFYKRKAGVDGDVPLLVDVESVQGQQDPVEQSEYRPTDNVLNEMLLSQVDEDEKRIRDELVAWFTSDDQFKLVDEELSLEQQESLKRVKKIAHEALEQAFSGKQAVVDDSIPDFLKKYR